VTIAIERFLERNKNTIWREVKTEEKSNFHLTMKGGKNFLYIFFPHERIQCTWIMITFCHIAIVVQTINCSYSFIVSSKEEFSTLEKR
jgi:hypothetical protein